MVDPLSVNCPYEPWNEPPGVKTLPTIDPPETVVELKSSFCPLWTFNLDTRLPLMLLGESRPAQPGAPLVVSVPAIEPETTVSPDGFAPVTLQPPRVAFTFTVALPVEAAVMGGLIEAVPITVLHTMVAPLVSYTVAPARAELLDSRIPPTTAAHANRGSSRHVRFSERCCMPSSFSSGVVPTGPSPPCRGSHSAATIGLARPFCVCLRRRAAARHRVPGSRRESRPSRVRLTGAGTPARAAPRTTAPLS